MTDEQAERLITALESIASSLCATTPGSDGQQVTITNAVGEVAMQLREISRDLGSLESTINLKGEE